MEEIIIRNKEDYDTKLTTNQLLNSFNVYCRVSTKDQIENTSLDSQMEFGIDYVTKNLNDKFDYIIIWREEGKSGDDLVIDEDMGEMVKRELLNIIMNNWKSRITKNIWILDLSRLSRNDEVSQLVKGIIYKSGIDLFIGNQKYDFDNKMDKLFFGMLSLFNEFENHQRFEKGLMGKRKNLDIGKWWGGTVPIGYKSVDGYIVEDEKTIGIVKNIFKWYIGGLSTIKIKERLEKFGIKTQRNQSHWNTNSIRKILTNTVYRGYIDYEVKGLKGKSKEYCRERGLTYKHKFKVPITIEENVWEDVQRMYRNRVRVKNTSNVHHFLFKDILYCGGCDTKMRGRQRDWVNENIYRCVSNEENYRDSRKVKCGKKRSVNREGLEQIVWIKVLEVFRDSEKVKEEFRNNNLPKKYDKENTQKTIKSNLKKIDRRVKNLRDIEIKKGENIGKNVIKKISDVQLRTILGIIEKEEEKLKNEVEELKLKNDLLENNNVWEEWFDSFKLYYNKICLYKSFDDRRKFVNDHIEKITVDWNEKDNTHNIIIQFKLNIVRDKGDSMGKDIYKIRKGKDKVKLNDINILKVNNKLKEKSSGKTLFFNYSTVTEWLNYRVNSISTPYTNKYNSLILNFTISTKTSKLTKTTHYTQYQQKLYDEVKRLKEVEELGYRKISYLIYDKGYRSVRTNSVLRNNFICSIYKKGKVREERINRDFETKIDDIIVYENV